MLTDTHAHIHHPGLDHQQGEVVARAVASGVTRIITVGCDEHDSALALAAAAASDHVWAAIGLHPHEAHRGFEALDLLALLAHEPKLVAIGECGLDYYRNLSSPEDQERALRFQIELALDHDLPLIFHVREAFADFYAILDDYPDSRGVVHCFTGTVPEMQAALARGLYVAINGIMTFTKDQEQLRATKLIPADKLLLETDCPFLAPAPVRGTTNEPANIRVIAEFVAGLRGETPEELSSQTTRNATTLFAIG